MQDSRASVMLGVGPLYDGVGSRIFWKKQVEVNASFAPSGVIAGIFQYTGLTESADKIVRLKNGHWYWNTIDCGAPAATPIALNFTSTPLTLIPDFSGITFATDQRVRAVQLGSEMIFVQQGGVQPVRFDGTNIYRLGIVTPSPPTDGGNVAGGVLVTGATYGYNLTFADSLGRLSSPSSPLSVVMGAGGARRINWSAPTDPQVVRVYLNRTAANESTFYRVVEAGFGVGTTTYVDNSLNDTLLPFNTQAPYPGENDPPQPASLISVYKFRLALNNANDPRELQISNDNEPGSFSQIGALYNSNGQLLNATDGTTRRILNEFGDEITALGHLGSVLGVWNRRTTGIFEGDNPAQFQFRFLHRKGCIAPDSVCECGNATAFMSEDGLYALDYQSGFSITKLSADMDALFKSAAVEFDPPGDWPPTTFFTREDRAAAATAMFIQNRYVLVTPPYTVVFDFNFNTMYQDYVTGMPYGDGALSKGYLCMSRVFANRQYEVGLYSPGIGSTSGPIGDLYVMSAYPLEQTDPGVPEPYDFVYQTRALDGNGVARVRLKKFKQTTIFGTIEPMTTADGTVTAPALFSGTITLVMDDGKEYSYFFDNISQISTNFAGSNFPRNQVLGAIIFQRWPVNARGKAVMVRIQGSANGILNLFDLLQEYVPWS